ncbi:MAG TPA: GNAT family N-acetyltransferase [Acidimicrobiia bacterium]|nr:GNAT family N-acetyltransferase [Acidimicrobiia bacterium]
MTAEAVGLEVELSEVPAATSALWATLVRQRRTEVFHSPTWAAVLADTYGFDVRARILHRGGSPEAGIAFVTLDDHLGRRHVTLPFSDFCDPLVDDDSQLRRLIDDHLSGPAAVTIKRRVTETRSDSAELTEGARFAWHGIDVGGDIDAAWDRLDSGARRAIRKAQAAGITVRAATSLDDLRSFFELHLAVRKYKYRLLSQPWRFFESIWHRFLAPGEGVLLLAEVEGRVVGGVLFLTWGDTLYYKFNASDMDQLSVRPNDVVLWEGMKWANESGLSMVDLGVSDLDQPGLIRYKQKYASQDGEVVVLRKPGAVRPGDAEARALLGEVTRLFVDPSVPDAITERAGDALYGFFT